VKVGQGIIAFVTACRFPSPRRAFTPNAADWPPRGEGAGLDGVAAGLAIPPPPPLRELASSV
jgi:hypothetical protein